MNGKSCVLGDLTDRGLSLAGIEVDVVFHVAGLAHRRPRNDAEKNRFLEINREGLRNLLRSLERSKRLPSSFLLVSSVAVYGVERGEMLPETTPRRALDPYGASKRQAEDVLDDWAARHRIRTAVVRLPLVVGKNAPGNWKRLVDGIAAGRYWGVGAGSARRSLVLARDVARALPRAAAHGGVYHLTDGYHPSFSELEQAIATALSQRTPRRLPMSVAQLGARAGDAFEALGVGVPFSSATLSKMISTLTFADDEARRLLQWRPSSVLHEIGVLLN